MVDCVLVEEGEVGEESVADAKHDDCEAGEMEVVLSHELDPLVKEGLVAIFVESLSDA